MDFPVTIVKGKEEAKVFHAADLKGWLDAGWSLPKEKPVKE